MGITANRYYVTCRRICSRCKGTGRVETSDQASSSVVDTKMCPDCAGVGHYATEVPLTAALTEILLAAGVAMGAGLNLYEGKE